MEIGFKWEDLLIGQLFPIQILVLSLQGRRTSYTNVLIYFSLIFFFPSLIVGGENYELY